jgi:hypothetical protein
VCLLNTCSNQIGLSLQDAATICDWLNSFQSFEDFYFPVGLRWRRLWLLSAPINAFRAHTLSNGAKSDPPNKSFLKNSKGDLLFDGLSPWMQEFEIYVRFLMQNRELLLTAICDFETKDSHIAVTKGRLAAGTCSSIESAWSIGSAKEGVRQVKLGSAEASLSSISEYRFPLAPNSQAGYGECSLYREAA